MIPILYAPNTSNFNNNGIGGLSDALKCIVTEERNGEYTLTMDYPIDGNHAESLVHSAIIKVLPGDGATLQLFRISKISKPINGIITIDAEHISYQLSFIPVSAFTANTCNNALQGLKSHSLESNPFTFWTNITTTASYKQNIPASLRSRLGGVQGSILDVYGGEYEWDNYTVKLYSQRGANRGVSLRYGKNITDIKQEENIQEVITGICPVYDSGEDTVTLPEGVIHASTASNYPYQRTAVIDFTSDFETPPTVAELRTHTQNYIVRNRIGIPKINIDVSFINLKNTEDYKDIANLETVKLCDTVTVIFEKLGIEATAKVIKTEWDVIKERYTDIQIGDAKSSLARTVVTVEATTSQIQKIAQTAVTSQTLKDAIQEATDLITGGTGGYLVVNLNEDGQPNELLLMDAPDKDDAQYVLRINYQGIGFSTTGYNGPFTTAWNINGNFNANWIRTGILTIGGTASSPPSLVIKDTGGNEIGRWSTAGISVLKGSINGASLTVGGVNNASGSITVKDGTSPTPNTIGTWNKDGLSVKKGAIEGSTIKFGGTGNQPKTVLSYSEQAQTGIGTLKGLQIAADDTLITNSARTTFETANAIYKYAGAVDASNHTYLMMTKDTGAVLNTTYGSTNSAGFGASANNSGSTATVSGVNVNLNGDNVNVKGPLKPGAGQSNVKITYPSLYGMNGAIGCYNGTPDVPGTQVLIQTALATNVAMTRDDGQVVWWESQSDERVKDNIKTLDADFIEKFFEKINPVSFNYKKDPNKKTYYGLTAQELEAVLKELGQDTKLTDELPDGIKIIDYKKMVGLCLGAIKNLYERIKKYEDAISNT